MTKDRPRYAGRVEYLAVREQVKALWEKGYSLAMAFRELAGAGKITMSYEQFTKYASGRARNVQPLYKPTQVKNDNRKKAPCAPTPQVNAGDIAVIQRSTTEALDAVSSSPNTVKVEQKRFGSEIKDSEVV